MGKKQLLMIWGAGLSISVLSGILIWEITQPVRVHKIQKMPAQNKVIQEVSPEIPSGNEEDVQREKQSVSDQYYGDTFFQQSVTAELGKKVPAQGSGRIYYASAAGESDGDGTREKPFSSLEEAVNRLQKGDALYLMPGIYTQQLKLPDTLTGTPEQYITIAAQPGAQAVLDVQGQKTDAAVEITGASYVRVEGLEIRNSGDTAACGVLVKDGSNHLIIQDNQIHRFSGNKKTVQQNSYGEAVLLQADSEGKIQDVLISDNIIQNCNAGAAGSISVQGNLENINIIGNQVYRAAGTGIQIAGIGGEGQQQGIPVHCLISQNQIAGCASDTETACAVSVSSGQHMKIVSNSAAGCMGGIFLSAEQENGQNGQQEQSTADIAVAENSIRNNLGFAVLVGGDSPKHGWVKDVRITGNNCQNVGSGEAVVSLQKCDGVTLAENTFHDSHGKGRIIDSRMSADYTRNVVFESNIYGNDQPDGEMEFLYLGTLYHDYEAWVRAAGETTNNIP